MPAPWLCRSSEALRSRMVTLWPRRIKAMPAQRPPRDPPIYSVETCMSGAQADIHTIVGQRTHNNNFKLSVGCICVIGSCIGSSSGFAASSTICVSDYGLHGAIRTSSVFFLSRLFNKQLKRHECKASASCSFINRRKRLYRRNDLGQ